MKPEQLEAIKALALSEPVENALCAIYDEIEAAHHDRMSALERCLKAACHDYFGEEWTWYDDAAALLGEPGKLHYNELQTELRAASNAAKDWQTEAQMAEARYKDLEAEIVRLTTANAAGLHPEALDKLYQAEARVREVEDQKETLLKAGKRMIANLEDKVRELEAERDAATDTSNPATREVLRSWGWAPRDEFIEDLKRYGQEIKELKAAAADSRVAIEQVKKVCFDFRATIQGPVLELSERDRRLLALTNDVLAALASPTPAAPACETCGGTGKALSHGRLGGACDYCNGTGKAAAGQSGGIDPRPRCIRCGKPWLPDEGLDATVWPCTECYGEAAKEASEP